VSYYTSGYLTGTTNLPYQVAGKLSHIKEFIVLVYSHDRESDFKVGHLDYQNMKPHFQDKPTSIAQRLVILTLWVLYTGCPV
jgi:hypothetical protein